MKLELLGKKLGMSQVYDNDNNLVPVTILEVGPCPIMQVKTPDNDGYHSVQIGYNPAGKSQSKVNRCKKGHAVKANVESQQVCKEFHVSPDHDYQPGSVLSVANLKNIPFVDVVSTVKGRGFQGVVKRWNFAGGPASHGSMFHRRGGSYGLCQWPGRVFKNKKMPGHMGNVQRTTQNLKVIKIIPEKNLILVKGSVPGHKGVLLSVRVAKKLKATN